ncbi:MAG TPA: amino acid adenylation domain-containing protein [Ktedonobacteraceae bacterium]|nr:amino acid adenylation domain-containing protein [Ktedonobacteraceae bacterium]
MDSIGEQQGDQLRDDLTPGQSESNRFPQGDDPFSPSRSSLFPDMFEAQAARMPDAIALLFDQDQITYQELNTRANRLAHFLQAQGIGTESRVGICLERSPEMIVALLATLKAGGAYVPLDPSYPPDRLQFMLRDARITLLLTQKKFTEMPDIPRLIMMDQNDVPWDLAPLLNPERALHPENLAYVIYTSGSTGQPKGTQLLHKGLENLLAGLQRSIQIKETDRILQLSSLSFDASVAEIGLAISTGATLCLQKREDILPGRRFTNLLQSQGISIALLVPSFLRRLPLADLPSWRVVISGGEACTPDLVARWAKGRGFFNAYAPTEATVCATLNRCQPDNKPLALGEPLPHLQISVLNAHLHPVHPGETGEIYLSGIGLARGYCNLPAATAEHFIPHPFAQQPGERLYKTGDLAQLLPGGQIAFLGRDDTQIKFHGFRIELGEIEQVLRECDQIEDVAVLCREDVPGDQRLVAYIVPQASHVETVRARVLEQYARTRLPPYMLPAQYVFLAAFPRTTTEKIDRKALPPPELVRPELATPLVLPTTPTERLLEEICREVLRLDHLGIHDTFFELGGNSLLIAQITARIERSFGVHVPLSAFFMNPSITGLTQFIDAQQEATSFSAREISVQPRDGRLFPLSFSQERIWFLEQLDPDHTSYTARVTIRFSGPLDSQALEQSLNAMVKRHEIFRTTFPSKDGHPKQFIHPAYSVVLPIVDLQIEPESERSTEVQSIVAEALRTPFELAHLPLAQWTLVRLHPHDHLLIHLEHHLLHDGWSFNIFMHELLELYKGFSSGRPVALPGLPVQFADFACWQREWLQGERAERHLMYWKQKLAGSLSVLPLSTDYPRPAVRGFHGATVRMVLPSEQYEALKVLSLQEEVTLFMTMLAAFQVLLSRYTGQDDICVGTGIANRRLRETEALIGMIINTIVLRVDLSGDPTFEEVLRRVREVTLEAYEHQDLPFSQVVEALRPPRYLSHNPLFQVGFSFHDAPLVDVDLSELSVEILGAHDNGSAKFDINVIVVPPFQQSMGQKQETTSGDLMLIWEYDSDLFKLETIQRMTMAYQRLLEGICADSTQRVALLALLTLEEYRQQVLEWNNTQTTSTSEQSVVQMFEKQAQRAPHAVALSCEHEQLTYQELNVRANQLAYYLQGLSVEPQEHIAVCMGRCSSSVIALLAILKAGGVYLPLDPAYPLERLAWMLEDAEVRVLLTSGTVGLSFTERALRLISLDHEAERLVEQATSNPSMEHELERLAYVIYTSGSTGRPKGVQVTQRGLSNLVCWHQRAFGLTPQDRTTQVASLSFDAAGWEIWPTLTIGATLCLVRDEIRTAPQLLRDWLATQCITMSFLPTPLAERLLEIEAEESLLTNLRTLLIGGDLLHQPPARKYAYTLVNNYGPTESSVVATSGIVDLAEDERFPSIGRPIANTQVYVLDRHMQPVPIGVAGELFLGGDGLARGYLGHPELTAQCFIPHPFSEQPGARLYRTGDIVRYSAGSSLHFLRRNDSQVKIRGFRIELDEIEAVLCQHPAVKEAAVVAHERMPAQKYLVAYLVPHVGPALDLEQVRRYLQTRLPAYMHPLDMFVLESLPVTVNGKLDRHALPVPEAGFGSTRPDKEYIPPRNSDEEMLAGIWAEVLGITKVGIHENFFALGGHSLLATQILARIQNVFQVSVPLQFLFEHPTVAGLTSVVAHSQQSAPDIAPQRVSRTREEENALRLLTRIEHLSADEIDSLLWEMLSEEEG